MGKIKFKGERTASTLKIIAGLLVYLSAVFASISILQTIIIAAVAVAAVYEFMKAFGTESKILYTVAGVVSAAEVIYIGFLTGKVINLPEPSSAKIMVLYSFYVILILCLMIVFNSKIKYVHAMAAFVGSIAIPYALSGFLMLKNITYFVPSMNKFDGSYLVAMAFVASWITDSFAFLVGRKLGKHKMCPKISPKKSVEGAIGGVLFTMIFVVVLSIGFSFVSQKMGYDNFLYHSNIKYLFIGISTIALSIISMFGDLAASVLKRNVGIKDFSNLLPGHGGIMDRFDSCLFVVPSLFGIVILLMA